MQVMVDEAGCLVGGESRVSTRKNHEELKTSIVLWSWPERCYHCEWRNNLETGRRVVFDMVD